ncbi:MAG TPA: RNase adapter RapZ [Gammaproteobacteria bacterium]|nr:RNase adapter RapZ [Gammaproteobacteria bacterium]
MKLIIISGLSGSGKSTALQALEDLSYYCIDNLPVGLLPAFATQMINASQQLYKNAAVCIDARNLTDDLQRFPQVLDELRGSGVHCEVFFLAADDKALLKRFSETRRKHPLTRSDLPLAEAIAHERRLLEPVAAKSDVHLDTSNLNVHQLREMVRKRVEATATTGMTLLFQSFGYKKGIPADADFVFDVRCLPNPHWELELRALNGQDAAVASYLEGLAPVRQMFADIKTFLETWIPFFEADNRSYMTIALGCTGGQHRSVYLAKLLADYFRQKRDNVLVRHRELL